MTQDDHDWDDDSDLEMIGDVPDTAVPLSGLESDLVRKLSSRGIEFLALETEEGEEEGLVFQSHSTFADYRGARSLLPRAAVGLLLEQLENEFFIHPDYIGILSPAIGYAELAVRRGTRRPTTLGLALAFSRDLETESAVCRHAEGAASLPKIPVYRLRPEREIIIHLASEAVCLEISGASPCATVWGFGNRYSGSPDVDLTLKFDFHEQLSTSDMVSEIQTLLSSLMYELDVRNAINIQPLRRLQADALPRRPSASRAKIPLRFPEMSIEPDVATLFNFASAAVDNPTLSYLFYYQVLEYFFPSAVRRSSLKRIKDELSDPLFSKSNTKSLMRILTIAEKSANQTEERQIKTLLEDCVRSDQLLDFFSTSEWGAHFTRKGPIRGVENINVENRDKKLSDQVADRVYQIRNRIVHAKDDIRYDQARALLPQSAEAESLRPDLALMRLLASEVVLHNQS